MQPSAARIGPGEPARRSAADSGAAGRLAALAWPWLPLALLAILSAGQVALDPRTRQLAVNTLRVTGGVVGLSLLVGVPLAILLARTDAWGRRAAAWLLTVLMLLPLYLQAAGWQAGFGLQGWFTLRSGGHALLQGYAAAIWIHAAAAIPWVVVIVGLGLRLAEPELEELAALDFPPLGVLTRVTLRRAAPAIAVAGIWVALVTAGEMTVTNLFLVRTYAEEIYTQIALGGEPGVAPLSAAAGDAGHGLAHSGRIVAGRRTGPAWTASQPREPLCFSARAVSQLGQRRRLGQCAAVGRRAAGQSDLQGRLAG